MSFELTAFPLLGIERFLYGYIYQFPESFKRCCKGPLKSLLDYDEGVYWQVAKHLGVGIKVFQFGVLGYDLVLRRSLSLAEPRLLCPDHKGDKLKTNPGGMRHGGAGVSLRGAAEEAGREELAFHPLVRPEDELLEAGRWKKPAKEDESKGHLIYLTGARSLLALWILGDHFIHRASVFTDRSNVAVAAFISLSGFVTQWAYSTRDFSRLGTVFQYLVRRIGRVALTTYFAMLAAVGVLAVQTHIPSWRHMVRCFLFVETWLQPENWCPDGQSWTIAALLPSWLLYPSMKHLVGLMEKKYGALGLLQLLLALWMISAGPSLVVFLLQDGFLTNKQHNLAYLWPPSQMPDFAIGVIAATLAKRHDASSAKSGLPPAWLRGLLADLSLIIIFAVVLLVPSSGYHEGWEPLYNHSLGPLWALFFYGSAASQGSGISACTLGMAPLAVLGRYSFEVFLFQQPLFNAFEILWIAGMNEVLPMWGFATIFLVTLYTLSAIYAECIEAPFVSSLRSATSSWGVS
ncbi:unnamed protein product [Symbiodinium necroappetens]|uniref:Acyltransferase 3 domain-containing protein n=1 Tax=Symbiodinium necroappetens TaxID=1628268 RepID=A0A812RLN6_9DINO|nr:unnamed protein product [Symbiodinium necroappetens]